MTEPIASGPVVIRDTDRRHYLRGFLIAILITVLLALALLASGIFRYEHRRGFFAPAWGPDNAVYFLERETRGWVFHINGAGSGLPVVDIGPWSWVLSDRVRVQRFLPTSGTLTTLRSRGETAVAGQVFQSHPAAVFGIMLATLNTRGGLSFTVHVRKLPLPPGQAADLEQQQVLLTGRADNVIANLRELMAVPGEAFYPAAIVTTVDNSDYEVLLHNRRFNVLYPDGIPAPLLARLSQRGRIDKQNEILARRQQLIEDYRQKGLSLQAAVEQADQTLAKAGYRVLEPRLLATSINQPQTDEPVFAISRAALESGDFADIVEAIETPGRPVVKQDEPYTSTDKAAQALNDWLAAGRVSWVMAVDGRYYRLLLRY